MKKLLFMIMMLFASIAVFAQPGNPGGDPDCGTPTWNLSGDTSGSIGSVLDGFLDGGFPGMPGQNPPACINELGSYTIKATEIARSSGYKGGFVKINGVQLAAGGSTTINAVSGLAQSFDVQCLSPKSGSGEWVDFEIELISLSPSYQNIGVDSYTVRFTK